MDPPTCDPDLGCRILQPNPPYFTNATGVSFSFSSFGSPRECSHQAVGPLGPLCCVALLLAALGAQHSAAPCLALCSGRRRGAVPLGHRDHSLGPGRPGLGAL